MKIRGWVLFVLLIGCAPAASPTRATAAVYYVAVDGDNNNPGTLAQPWRTVQYAADQVIAGDVVWVRGGVYNERVTIQASGSEAEGAITFQSYTGETAVLDGAGLTVPDDNNGLFLIDSQAHITIEGFELRNYTTTNPDRVPIGIFVTGDAHHIRLRNNLVHHIENNGGSEGNAHGIAIYGTEAPNAIHDLLIEGNELRNLTLGNSEALVLNGNVTNFVVSHNQVHDNDNIGLDFIGFEGVAPDPVYDQARDGVVSENVVYNIDTINNPAYFGEQSAAGIYVDGGTRIVIERNHVYQSNFGIEIASEHDNRATSDITVRNNLLVHNHIAGLAMGGYDTQRGRTENCAIVNNTFFENDANQTGSGELLIQFDTRDNIIKNNIFFANQQSLFFSNDYVENQGNVVDYNLYFAPDGSTNSEWGWQNVYYTGFDAYRTATGNDAHALFADPHFVNTAVPDLHLLAGSPAIDQGENLTDAGLMDFDGNIRQQNGRVDMGAFEWMAPIGEHYLYLPTIIKLWSLSEQPHAFMG